MPAALPARRQFLGVSAAGSLALFLTSSAASGATRERPLVVRTLWGPDAVLDATTIPRFVTPLVLPARMPRTGVVRSGGVATDVYDIAARQVQQQMLPAGMPSTTVFAYGPVTGHAAADLAATRFPSRTIDASYGRPARIRWRNELLDAQGHARPHLLPVDPTLHWANPGCGVSGRDERPTFTSTPDPYAGPVPLVTHGHEVPLVIADRAFRPDGSLFYPGSRSDFDAAPGPYVPDTDLPPIWNPEFFGNTLTVNGSTWPVWSVERRRYRVRVLNGCGARFLMHDFGVVPGVFVHRIGNDGGFLDGPVAVPAGEGMLLAPGERADLVVDFAAVPKGRYVVRNLGSTSPTAGGGPGRTSPRRTRPRRGRSSWCRWVARGSRTRRPLRPVCGCRGSRPCPPRPSCGAWPWPR